jgi:protoheme IX farnesyltransferase
MLPVVASTRRVATEMVYYGVAMVVTGAALIPVASMTWVYAIASTAAGLWFLWGCVQLLRRARRDEPKLREMRLFRDSILYLTVVFAAVLVDPFVPSSLTVFS